MVAVYNNYNNNNYIISHPHVLKFGSSNTIYNYILLGHPYSITMGISCIYVDL